MSAIRLSTTPRLLSRCANSVAISSATGSSSLICASNWRAARRYNTVASSTLSGCAPKRVIIGICRVNEVFSESMVWIRRRNGFANNCQPRTVSRANTCCANTRVCESSPPSSTPAPLSLAAANAPSTRARISAAALRVKVIAITSSGSSTVASSAR